ncbi:MAG: aldo/keto reductase [Clostridia bacterium]|nr:aldo/keto reductase [Clostridia bacterium]
MIPSRQATRPVKQHSETFSGVPYDLALEAVERLKTVFTDAPLAHYAIRWVLMYPAVSVVIPGASRASQVESNVLAANLPPLTDEQMAAVQSVHNDLLRDVIHPQW